MMYKLPSDLRVSRYRLALESVDPISLPRHTGSTLRGGLGTALKQVSCHQSAQCDHCAQSDVCAYGYVFETSVPADAAVLRHLSDIPRPFALDPPAGPVEYQPGEAFSFQVTLIGRGMDYWPYFLQAFRRLGQIGIGPGRGRFRLVHAWTLDPLGPLESLIYDGTTDQLRNEQLVARAADMERAGARLPTDKVTVRFLTPTQLKHDGQLVREPAFHVLIRTLLRRLSSLAYFHCGKQWQTDYRGIIETARQVRIAETALEWDAWERFSQRQERRLSMGGITGSMTYVGDLELFGALLVAGTVVHVGKSTVFGNGRYQIG